MTSDSTDEREIETTERSLTIERSFDASPEHVFDAWVTPEIVKEWLFTRPSSENTNVEIDAQVGGEYTITDRRDGESFTTVGEYLEIDRPSRLVFTFAMPQFSTESNRIDVEIEPRQTGCVLTLIQESHSWPAEHAAEYKRESKEGWIDMFDMLATQIEGTD